MAYVTMFHCPSTVEHDCVPPPTKVPHHLPSADPITTENSAYCLGEDSQEKEERCKCINTSNLECVYMALIIPVYTMQWPEGCMFIAVYRIYIARKFN